MRIHTSRNPIKEFGKLATEIFSGTTPLSKGDAYCGSDDGVPFIRSGQITEDGDISLVHDVWLRPTIHNGLMKRSQLRRNDVLIAIVGATIGAAGVYESDNPANINQAIAAVRFPTNRILPRFAVAYLHTPAGQGMLDYLKRPVARANINLEEIGEIVIPLPPLPKQRELLTALDAARAARRAKLAQADALLAGLDGFVLDALGLTLPPPDGHRTTYAVRTHDVRTSRKLYPDYFHPERMNAIRAVQSRYTGDRAPTLQSIADFVRDQRIVDPGEDYLGLANIQPNTGERIVSTEEDGKGNCSVYAEGDVLFARLRPYLNKVYRAEFGGVCSTEFHVIRVHRDGKGRPRLIPDYLAAVLRCSVVLAQTRHMMTGNTHPRLANEDVVNLVVPVPDYEIQDQIAGEVARRREEARRLRDEAQIVWDDAKRRFEEELLGPEPDAKEPKTGNTKGGRKQ